jgi:hypothetical protein
MATKTLGTTANNVLDALQFSPVMTQADVATLQQAIKFDGVEGNRIAPQAFTRTGLLYIPRRGVLRVLDGDWVGVDAQGWPVLVSANSINSGATEWAHN